MDAIQFLRTEHRKASDLLRRLRSANEVAERQLLFAELKRELESDAAVEKEYFYPTLLQREATAELAGGGMHDLDNLHELLVKLEALPEDDVPWQKCLEQLQRALDEHRRKEEETLFQGVRGVLSEPQREELGERMRTQKLRLIDGGLLSRAQQRPRDRPEQVDAPAAEDFTQFAKERSQRYVEDQVRRLAGQVQVLSQAIKATAENLRRQPDHALLSNYLQRAADGLEQMRDALRDGDINRLVARSSAMAQRQPALFIGGAVMAGFLLTRFLKALEKKAAGL